MLNLVKQQTRPLRDRLKTYWWDVQRKENFLEVLAIFKNEAHVLDEWVQHYIQQGCDCINLINNNSTDDYLAVLKPYIETNKCRLFQETGRHAQYAAYNCLVPLLRRRTTWLIVCDLDEFIYARKGYATIREYLARLPWSSSCIQIPCKVFGSSGHKKQPGGGLVDNFLWRCDYTSAPDSYYAVSEGKIDCKYIARLSRVRNLCCHRAELFRGKNHTPDGVEVESAVKHKISEDIFDRMPLHVNHYPLQSEEFFRTVKMTRGDAMSSTGEAKRTLDFFYKYDINEKFDDELSQISRHAVGSCDEPVA